MNEWYAEHCLRCSIGFDEQEVNGLWFHEEYSGQAISSEKQTNKAPYKCILLVSKKRKKQYAEMESNTDGEKMWLNSVSLVFS